jgi:hypothetical protein
MMSIMRWRSSVALAIVMVTGCAEVLELDRFGSNTSGVGGSAAGGASSTATVASATTGSGGMGGTGGAPCTSSYATMVKAAMPVVYWRLGEAAAETIAHNEMPSGTQYDGTFYDNVTRGEAALIACDADTAVRIGAPNTSRIEVADGLDFASAAPFSIEAWVQATDLEFGSIVRKSGATGPGYELYYDTGGVKFAMADGVSTTQVEDASIVVGTSYHVVATYDGTDMCIHVNAAPPTCKATSKSLPDTNAPLLIGRSMIGWLDEVAIYPRALSQQEVQDHHQAGLE